MPMQEIASRAVQVVPGITGLVDRLEQGRDAGVTTRRSFG
jgi:hypothetical protein